MVLRRFWLHIAWIIQSKTTKWPPKCSKTNKKFGLKHQSNPPTSSNHSFKTTTILRFCLELCTIKIPLKNNYLSTTATILGPLFWGHKCGLCIKVWLCGKSHFFHFKSLFTTDIFTPNIEIKIIFEPWISMTNQGKLLTKHKVP